MPYDLLGRPLYAHFGSAGGSGVDMAWDALGRMTSQAASGRTLAYQWDLAGNRTRLTWPDGLYVDYVYDTLNRMTQIRENGATTGVGVLDSYAYDDLGRRTTITRAGPPGSSAGSTTNYAYAAGRLSTLNQDLLSTSRDLTLTYGYDASGGIVSRALSNDTYLRHPAAGNAAYVANGLDQYLTVAGTGVTHDARGNLTSDGTRSFTYDIENRLLTASGPTAVSLGYDPLGRLQTTTASGATTTYLYDGQNLVGEYNAAGTVLRRYVPGPGTDEPALWYEGAGTTGRRWPIADEAGSIIGYTGPTGGSAGTYGYGPFGEPDVWTGLRYRYTGQIMIPEAQLYYYKARVYDPGLGRFLQTDPVGQAGGVNIYAYVGNDPLNFTDGSGLTEDCLTHWTDNHDGTFTPENRTVTICASGGGSQGGGSFSGGYTGGLGGGGGSGGPAKGEDTPQSTTCQGTATFSAVGPLPQAPGDSAFAPGTKPASATVAIAGASTFGFGWRALRNGAAGAIQINPSGLGDLLKATGGPQPPYSVGDYGDANIRDASGTRFDIYRFDTLKGAQEFGKRTVPTTITVPPGGHCPPGFK